MSDIQIVEQMQNLSADFRKTGMFQPKLLRQACESLGIEVDYSLLHQSSRPSRGWYQYNGSGLNMEEIKKAARAKKPAAQMPEPEVQAQEVVVTEVKKHEKKVAKVANFNYVPDVDPSFVSFGCYKDIERIVKSKTFFPTYITGLSGNGKSSAVIQACATNKLPLIRISITKESDREYLIGTKSLSEGNVVIEEGPLLVAMRSGIPVLLEELDAGQPNNLMCLQGILEGRPFFFELTGEYIIPAPGFNVFATGNTKGKGSDDGRYMGTNILNDAFLERFSVTFEQEFPNEATETKIVLNWMEKENCVDEQFATDLAKWAAAIRKTYFDGGIDDLIATRRLNHIVKAYSIFRNKTKAVELGTGRFDDHTSRAFRDLFSKITTPETVVPEDTNATV